MIKTLTALNEQLSAEFGSLSEAAIAHNRVIVTRMQAIEEQVAEVTALSRPIRSVWSAMQAYRAGRLDRASVEATLKEFNQFPLKD